MIIWASPSEERGVDERIIHAAAGHGYAIMVDIKPEHEMEPRQVNRRIGEYHIGGASYCWQNRRKKEPCP